MATVTDTAAASPARGEEATTRPEAFASGLLWLVVPLVALVPHLWVQLSTPGIIGLDGYYHMRYAELLRLAGPRLAIPFPWLPTTILNPASFVDHHLLFHLALMPFTLGNLIVGAKVAAVLFAAAATLTWFLVAHAQRVRAPLVWLLILVASSSAWLYRMSMTRRQSLVLVLLLAAVHLVLTRRLRWLVALGFAFVWLYDGWPVLMAVVALACVGRWLEDRRVDLLPGLAPLGGVLLGLVVNPFFPNTLTFPILHLLPKLEQLFWTDPLAPRVGTEWYPFTPDYMPKVAGIAVALPIIGLLATAWVIWQRRARPDARLVAWGGCALLFLGLFLKQKRWIEYEPALAAMFAALAWTALLETPRVRDLVARAPEWLRPLWLPATALVLPLVLVSLGGIHLGPWRITGAYDDARGTDPPGYYSGAGTWLSQNTLPGERVFSTDWDDFPRLFYYDTRNTYLVGLDPTYMYQYDPQLYIRWRSITRGEVQQPGAEIRDRFGCRWVFTDTKHNSFIKQARADPRFQQVYADADAVVFFVAPG